jgi:hypothetical protein
MSDRSDAGRLAAPVRIQRETPAWVRGVIMNSVSAQLRQFRNVMLAVIVGSVSVGVAPAMEGTNSLLAPNLPVTFEFDRAVRAFSVDLIDNFTFAPASYSLSLNGGPAQTLFDLPNYVEPRPRVIQFLGILDLDGIDSLALSSFYHINPDVDAGLIRMDRMRYEDTTATPVPEPSTMLLLGAGLAGVARFRKRRA